MGESLNKTKIVEFNGVPGSGKTTIARAVCKELENSLHTACNFSQYYSKIKKKIFLKALLKSKAVHIRFFIYSICAMKGNNKVSMKHLKIIMSAFKHFIVLNWCYQSQRYQYIIMDQGFVQNWISYYYDKELDSIDWIARLFTEVEMQYPQYYIINTFLTQEKIIERLNARLQGTSRLDRQDDQSKSSIVNIQISNFSLIRKSIPLDKTLNINTNEDILYNVQKVIDFMVNDRDYKK